MKKYNIIYLIVTIIVVIICCVGCTKKNQNEITNNSNAVNSNHEENIEEVKYEEFEEIKEAIADDIKEYASIINTINMYYNAEGEVSGDDYLVSSLIVDKKGTKNPLSTLGYTLFDITNDGIKEFLIYDMKADEKLKNTIISLYTKKINDSGENENYHILNSQKSCYYELCENGVIRATYSENPEVISKHYYKINGEYNLELIEMLEYITNENGTITIKYRKQDEEYSEILSEEAENIENKYTLQEIIVSPIIK